MRTREEDSEKFNLNFSCLHLFSAHGVSNGSTILSYCRCIRVPARDNRALDSDLVRETTEKLILRSNTKIDQIRAHQIAAVPCAVGMADFFSTSGRRQLDYHMIIGSYAFMLSRFRQCNDFGLLQSFQFTMTRTADTVSIIIISVLDSVADTDFLSLVGINDHHDCQ